MSDADVRRHREATTCSNCRCAFTHGNYKVKHHDHVTGEYLFPCCNNCNLQLKPKKSMRTNSYLLPIVFHNLNYDGHFYHQIFPEAVHPTSGERRKSHLRRCQGHTGERRTVSPVPDMEPEIRRFLSISQRVTRRPGQFTSKKWKGEFSKHDQVARTQRPGL